MQSHHTSNFMPLDVGADVLEIVQRVCDRALNVATASAKSSTHGPKAGMRAIFGKTVQHLPGGHGIVKDRALKLAVEKKKRKPGRSGASNWPRGSRAARERSRAECGRRAAEHTAIRCGEGAFAMRSHCFSFFLFTSADFNGTPLPPPPLHVHMHITT